MAEIKTIYNAINEDKTMKRYVDLRDIKIESRDDLLKTCQVLEILGLKLLELYT